MNARTLIILAACSCIIFTAAPVFSQNTNSYQQAYQSDLQRRIKRAWFPLKGDETKKVTVAFFLHKDGSVTNVNVSDSSGSRNADEAAMRAVLNAAPFRPLQTGIDEGIQHFTFDYNVYAGGMSSQLATTKGQGLLEEARNCKNHGWYDKAVLAYKAALAADPKNATAWQELGQVFEAKGDRGNAMGCFAQAHSIDPSLPQH